MPPQNSVDLILHQALLQGVRVPMPARDAYLLRPATTSPVLTAQNSIQTMVSPSHDT